MRISDWSSDVCSSDLTVTTLAGVHKELRRYDRAAVDGSYLDMAIVRAISERIGAMSQAERAAHPCIGPERADLVGPEERRVGKEGVRTCRSRGSPYT